MKQDLYCMYNDIAPSKRSPNELQEHKGQPCFKGNTVAPEYLTSLLSFFYELGAQHSQEEQRIQLADFRNELIIAEDTIEELRVSLDLSRQQRDSAQDCLDIARLSIQQSLLMMERLLLELEARQDLDEAYFFRRELKKISTHLSQRI
ncbi:hypothetical protein EAG18_08415 [Pseudoalteromonas sp. J010]|uniref:hypothetical protein n=1 Tax=Pseudoalteromonas sp. J010 TaxID=998465 RepID=UPI000FB28B7D|nr:hypothetical protein [Pseudoalteromonas sp. J010]RRS09134.1 hypothetical protein EAG18_08415 [Pseudoalteromonas sp. J010]